MARDCVLWNLGKDHKHQGLDWSPNLYWGAAPWWLPELLSSWPKITDLCLALFWSSAAHDTPCLTWTLAVDTKYIAEAVMCHLPPPSTMNGFALQWQKMFLTVSGNCPVLERVSSLKAIPPSWGSLPLMTAWRWKSLACPMKWVMPKGLSSFWAPCGVRRSLLCSLAFPSAPSGTPSFPSLPNVPYQTSCVLFPSQSPPPRKLNLQHHIFQIADAWTWRRIFQPHRERPWKKKGL